MRRLYVYYDNPNSMSDKYLEVLSKNCEKKDVHLEVFNNKESLWEATMANEPDGVLPLLPLKDLNFLRLMRIYYHQYDIDCTASIVLELPATSQGIYNHVADFERSKVIGVIGRGKVGFPLIKKLIKTGFTVIEMNSKTPHDQMLILCSACDIIVGAADAENILNDDDFTYIAKERMMKSLATPRFIDTGRNFNFQRFVADIDYCGKWTRDVLFERLEANYNARCARNSEV